MPDPTTLNAIAAVLTAMGTVIVACTGLVIALRRGRSSRNSDNDPNL